jgi:hypothetical protein
MEKWRYILTLYPSALDGNKQRARLSLTAVTTAKDVHVINYIENTIYGGSDVNLHAWECRSAVEKYKGMCVRYYL